MLAAQPALLFRAMLDSQLWSELTLLASAVGQMAAGIIQHSRAIKRVKQLWHGPCHISV